MAYESANVVEDNTPSRATNGKARTQYALYQQACLYRAQVKDDQWKQVGEYLWGNQGIRRTASVNQSDFVYNLVHKDHQLALSMLARDTPSIQLTALTPTMHYAVEPLTAILNHNFEANDFVVRMVEMLSYGLPFGISFFKVTWDKTMRMGLGDNRIEVADPRNVYFMPGISTVRKSLVLTEKQCLDKLTVLHMYPDQWRAVNELFKKTRDYADAGDDLGGGEDKGNYVEPEGGDTTYLTRGVRGKDDRPYIELCQQWYIDPTTIKEIPRLYDRVKEIKGWKELSDEQQENFMSQPLYPRGRLAVFCEDHLFDVRKNPFPSFPYMQYMNQFSPVMKPGDELGMGEYDQLLEVQDSFNALRNQVRDGLEKSGTHVLTAEDVDREEWSSDPYGIFSGVRGNVQQVTTPPPSAEAFRAIQDEFALARELQNRSDVSQGVNPSGARSAEQVDRLSDNANRVMVTRTHSLEACIKSVIRYQISMVGAYYERGMHYPDSVDLSGINPDAFEVTVRAGLNLPASESQKLLWIRTLRQMEALDNELVLMGTPESYLPMGKEFALEHMRSKWAAEAQALREQQSAEVADQQASAANQRSQAVSNVIPMPQGAM